MKAVQAICQAITSLFTAVTTAAEAANTGAEVLDRMVQDAAVRQTIRSAADMEHYKNTYTEQASMRRVEAQVALIEFLNKRPENASLYKEAQETIQAAVQARMKARQSKENVNE